MQQLHEQLWSKKIATVLFCSWSAVLAFLLVINFNFFCGLLQPSGYTNLLLWGIFLFLGVAFAWYKFYGKSFSDKAFMAIFGSSALLLRLIWLPLSVYIPSNDFYNYYQAGFAFVQNGFSQPCILDGYGIPTFSGLAILNGFLEFIFSPTVLGMQVAGCVMTSLICVMIFLIVKRIDRQAAVISTLLYMVYPASILSSQIITNHHGATLFLLIGFYLYILAWEKSFKGRSSWCQLFGCSVSFVLSNFFHPSVIIALCAVIAFSILDAFGILLLKKANLKKAGAVIFSTISVVVMYLCISNIALAGMKWVGFTSSTEGTTVLSKIVVGLNQETGGTYSEEDYRLIQNTPRDQQVALCLKLIQERCSDPTSLIALMLQKNSQAWMQGDNYFYFYTEGIYSKFQEDLTLTNDLWNQRCIQDENTVISTVINSVSAADTIYVYVLWFFAVIGLFSLRKIQGYHLLYLVAFLPLGWMAFISFTEMQSRYRYPSMPSIVILAAVGFCSVREFAAKFHSHVKRHKLD